MILVAGAAVVAALGVQPRSAEAGMLVCDSHIFFGGDSWVLQFECGGGLEGFGCYSNGMSHETFECAFSSLGGPGCDESSCNDTF